MADELAAVQEPIKYEVRDIQKQQSIQSDKTSEADENPPSPLNDEDSFDRKLLDKTSELEDQQYIREIERLNEELAMQESERETPVKVYGELFKCKNVRLNFLVRKIGQEKTWLVFVAIFGINF
jgi:hypothetical protein